MSVKKDAIAKVVVRRVTRPDIPDAVGKNVEGDSWIIVPTWSRKGIEIRKLKGEKSMDEKHWCSEGVWEQGMQDPHAMVKADCLKPHPQLDEFGSHRYNT